MKVTIREVARRAGVSVASVSRVFNGKGPVAEETRQRILAVAEELCYAPHGAARSLITARTENVGVLLPDMHGEFFSELIRSLDRAARRSGYHLLVSSSHSELGETQTLLRSIRGRVDGLILMSPELDSKQVEAWLPEPMPLVLLNCRPGGRHDVLRVDDFGGARAMVRHLASAGHRRIAHVAGPANNFDARERVRGYRAALAELGLPSDPSLELEGDFSEAAGYRAGRELLRRPTLPDALFAANDAMALGALYALTEAGVEVPGRLALAGFDDIPLARFTSPRLTTVKVPIDELGNRAFERLLDAIADGPQHQGRQEELETQLIVRASCGASVNERATDEARAGAWLASPQD